MQSIRPENCIRRDLKIRLYEKKEVVMRIRSFRTPLIAGVGAVALAGSLIVPGIAGADAGGKTDTFTAEGRFTLTATDNGNCTASFKMTELKDVGKYNWRADHRVDGEDANFTAYRDAYRPVVVSNEKVAEAIGNRAKPYPVAVKYATVDLRDDRIVPTQDDAVTKTAPGVAANDTGTHTVDFGMYNGPDGNPAGQILPMYDGKATITVTGCPTTEVPEDETPDAGSLNFGSLFGSLGEFKLS